MRIQEIKRKKKIKSACQVSEYIYTQVDNQWVSVADSNTHTTMVRTPHF
jgi:hypothetical protein